MRSNLRYGFLVALTMLMVAGNSLHAQDLHFSQFFNSPLTTNPANTGFIPDANYRIGVNYRNQWSSIVIPYRTMSVFGDMQLLRDQLVYGWLGIGGVILRDEAGSGGLTSTKYYASIAYHQLLGESSLLTAGFNVGSAQKKIDFSQLTFNSQWNEADYFFDSKIPNGEKITNSSISYFDMQVGVNYAFFPTDNFYLNTGFSVHHINSPRETFYAGDNQIDRRYIAFLNASWKLSDQVIINPAAYYTTQAGATEAVGGGYVAYDLSGNGDRQLLGGAYYRVKDAAIVMVGYKLSNLQIMFNYDATVSSLGTYNNHNGAYEVSLIYTGLYPNQRALNNEKKFRCPAF